MVSEPRSRTVALEAGHNVVATGRNTEAVTAALGQAANLLVAKLDITSPQDAHETRRRRPRRDFGTIDVLVNNAGISVKGFFEETDARSQSINSSRRTCSGRST